MKGVDYVEKLSQVSFLDNSDCGQTVDTLPKRSKRKQLEINVDGALIELNLLLLPLAPVGRERMDVGSIIVKWIDSNGSNRGIKVSMTDGYGMLSRFDINVLNALMKLYSEQNKIMTYDYEKNKYNMPVEINYSIRALTNILKYKKHGGSSSERVQKSIRKLANCTITSLFEGGLYDSENKCYIKGVGEKGFHIIETYEMYKTSNLAENDKRISPNDVKDFNKVIINNFFYKSMCNGYTKIIDFNQLLELKSDVAQRIFSLLEGWYCDKKPFVYFNYETLYARIPLNPITEGEDPMPIKYRNRAIKKACKELQQNGYLANFVAIRKGVYFIFDGEIDATNIDNFKPSFYGLNKYSDLNAIINTLSDYGIETLDIDTYVKQSELEYYGALLRYYDMMIRYDKIRDNPVGFLIAGLKEKYNIAEKYYKKENASGI